MSESELDKFTEQLGQVLDHASDMNALDLEAWWRPRTPSV